MSSPARFVSLALRLASVVLCCAGVCAAHAQPNPYRAMERWLQPPAGRVLGSVSAVDVAPDGSIWVAERCGANDCVPTTNVAPILKADGSGKVVASFGAGRFAWPHGIYVDSSGNIWVTDARAGNG